MKWEPATNYKQKHCIYWKKLLVTKFEMKVNFKENYVLENEVVRLNPLEAYPFDYILDFSINKPELWKYNLGGAMELMVLKTWKDTYQTLLSNEKMKKNTLL